MPLVTVYWPSKTAGAGEVDCQATGDTRLVADCKTNPVWFVAQLTMRLAPARRMWRGGPGKGRLKRVPSPNPP